MERIKGLTIGLDLDTLRVDSGLKDLRSSIRLMNSEMRANMSAFDYGERSLKKYGVQLDGLNKKLELQAKVTESARKHYEKMVAEHTEGSNEAENAAAAYNHESAQLNNLERHIQRVTKEMQAFKREQEIQSTGMWKAGDALQSFGGKLDDISSKARSAGGTLTKHLTAPIAGLVATVGGMGFKRSMDIEQVQMMMEHISGDAAEYEKRMNSVVDLVTDTRFGTAELGAEYAKFIGASASDESAELYSKVAMNLSAFKMDDQLIPQIGDLFTKSLQSGTIDGTMINQFTNAGVDILKTLGNKWGMSTDQVREKLREGSVDIHEVLNELSEGILEGTEGELGVTKAMGGMLEKSGRTLSGQIKNFFAAISQAGERLIKDTGLFDGVKNALDELRNMLRSGELDAILLPTFQGLKGAMEALVDIARKMFKWFSSLDDSAKEWIGKLVGLGVVIGPIITGLGIFGGIIAKVATGLGGFLKFIAPITAKFKGIEKVAVEGGKKVGLLSKAFTFLTGPIGITIGIITILTTAFIVAYKKSETFRGFVHSLGDKLKEVFENLKDLIRPGIDAVVGFFDETKEKIVGFINEEGASLLQAFKNIGSFIATVAGAIWKAIKWTFDQILKIVNFVMPAIELLIGMVWDSIKDLINGALKVIMGAVKVFSGLFTGDFSKMWEGVQDIFFGAIQAVWGYINLLFVGRIIKGVVGFARLFGSNIRNLWKVVTEVFSNSISGVWNFVRNGFNNIFNTVRTVNTTIRTTLQNIWLSILNTIRNLVTNLFTTVRNIFSNIRNSIVNLATRTREGIVGQWNRIRSSVTTLASNMWTSVRTTFNNMVDGAKKLPGRIGDGIKEAASKATTAVKNMGNNMLSALEKPINGMIVGVNWVTDKLGIKKSIADVKLPRFAKGTGKGGHKGGLAIVGEEGRELIKLPDGRSFVSPGQDTLLDLPKGTHVIPNPQTEMLLKSDIPHFAKGTGFFDGIKNIGGKIKSGVKKAWDTIGDVWSYATNPSKLVTKLLSGLGISEVSGFAKDMGSAAWSFVKSKPLEYIKGLFKDADGGGGKPAFGWPITSRFGYRIHPITGQPRLHAGVDYGAPSGSPIPSTTGGTVSYAGRLGGFGNLVKVKQGMWEMFYAHMSRILVGVGQSVKKGDILGLVGSTGASTGPHLHYETRKNGIPVNPLTIKGFADGGLIKKQQLAMVGEGNYEEIIIPVGDPRKRTNAMKLLALAGKKLGSKSGGSVGPQNLSSISSDNKHLEKIIEKLSEQVAETKEVVYLLTQLLLKDSNVYLDKRSFGEDIEPVITERQKFNEDRWK